MRLRIVRVEVVRLGFRITLLSSCLLLAGDSLLRSMTDSGPVLSDMEEGGDGMAKYAAMVLEFIKKNVFEYRKQVSVEEVVTLIAALTDISVSLLSRFRKDQVDPAKATEVGRDVFKYMVGRLGFDIDKLGKSNIYV